MPASESAHIVVLTTFADRAAARAMVRRLVNERLVACGTVVPGTSVYRWDGAVTEADEALVILKTRRARWDELAAAVQESHPYEAPELLALPVEAGLDAYLGWVNAETGSTKEPT
jgi:periplasmic divalent cation tolerance protein